MIHEFEEQTEPLNFNEKKCMNIIANGLRKRVGKEKVISNKEICATMNKAISDGVYKELSRDYKLNSVSVRKIVNHLRLYDVVPLLCANSTGYYVAETKEEAENYMKSLKDRIVSIQLVAKAYAKQFNEKFNLQSQFSLD